MTGRKRLLRLAFAALVCAALLPAAALAGASVSGEASAEWQRDYADSFQEGAGDDLLRAFSGEEFDGAVVESYTIDRYNACNGAAVLRLADGSLRAYALTARDGGWRIAQRSGDLSAVSGVNRARVWYGLWLQIALYEDDQSLGLFEFEGKPGELTLYYFSSQNADFIRAFVPSLRDVRFDNVHWSSSYAGMGDRADVLIGAQADVVYRHAVFEAQERVRHNAFCVPFEGFDAEGMLGMLGERTEAGVSFIDESELLSSVAARNKDGRFIDVPVLPQPLSVFFALPEPELASFEPGLRFDVYSGPGKNYLREANGRASVSTDDWILVFAEEDGWLMIAYRVGERQIRFGWIEATRAQAGVSVPRASWAREPVEIHGSVTNDPLYNSVMTVEGQVGWNPAAGALLGAMGDTWAYVEALAQDGTPVRGFTDLEGFSYVTPAEASACVNVPNGEWAALYDAPGGEETGRLYPGACVSVKEERSGMLRVVCYTKDYYLPSLNLFVQGWIDESAVVRGAENVSAYLAQKGCPPVRFVWVPVEDETPETIARNGSLMAFDRLLAEVGENAYLETASNWEGTIHKRSDVQDMQLCTLWNPETGENEKPAYVNLYEGSLGAEAVGGEEIYERCPSGTAVDVLMRERGAALVCVRTQTGYGRAYWVDEEYLVDYDPTLIPEQSVPAEETWNGGWGGDWG